MSARDRNAAVRRLNSGLEAWSQRWALVAGRVSCVECGCAQKPSEAEIPFSHADGCSQRGDFAQHPWNALATALDDLPPGGKP